jgi:hypothetical protein
MLPRILICIGALALVACGPKAVTTPAPAHPQPAVPRIGAVQPEAPAPQPSASEPEAEPPPQLCEAKVADVPTALFGDRILIRTPPNVELVEDNPTLATTYSSFVSTCDATIDRMSVLVFANDAGKPLGAYLAEFLDALKKSGYADGADTVLSNTDAEVMSAIEYPAADGQPPAKVLVAVTRKLDNVFIVFYQTQPDQWDGLSNSFIASARTLLVVPQ